jgi:hypothetical protein
MGGYPVPNVSTPERLGPFYGLGEVFARVIGAIDLALYRWAVRLQQDVQPRYTIEGIGNPILADFTAQHWHRYLYDPSAGAITATIPEPSYSTAGAEIAFTRVVNDTTNLVVTCPTATIQGSATYTITGAWKTLRLIDLGDQWAVEKPDQ